MTLSWFDTPARVGVTTLLLSGCLSVRSTNMVDGELVWDVDYGMGAMALVALGCFLYSAGRAAEIDDEHRMQRLGVLYLAAALSALRLWAATGYWPL